MSKFVPLFTTNNADNKQENQPIELGLKSQKSPYRILFVDDEINVLNALKRVFRQENYEILITTSAEEALEILANQEIHLIISDYRMPNMNGADLLRKVKEKYSSCIRIMLTGDSDTQAVMGAISDGAVYKFILKPWNDDDIRVTVSLALEQYDLLQRNKELEKDNLKHKKTIKALKKITVNNRSQLDIMLQKKGMLTEKQVLEIKKIQKNRNKPAIRIILDKGWISAREICKFVSKELMIEEVALAEINIPSNIAELLPQSFCETQLIIPLKLDTSRLYLAIADPLDTGLLDELRFITGLQIESVVADASSIKAKIEAVYGSTSNSFEEMEEVMSSSDPFEAIEIVIDDDEDEYTLEELIRSTEEPPAVRLVNAIIIEALRMNVSDIHIQPRLKNTVVRYRTDGILLDKIHIPHQLHRPLISRIKIMAELDISERRLPQDGRITVKTSMRIVDLRISTLPTINGEKVVMRILDKNNTILRLDEDGLTASQLNRIEAMIEQPQGIILATGPTGSGKTTTLYSLLERNANSTKNYLTIEDPVEYYLDLAGQSSIHEKIGLNFSRVLRAILRQDPDVILLGEIRDLESAEVAFHAAMTGHLVFSTLHTNSAVATVARLIDLGLKPYVIAAGLSGVIAQRLVRRICENCKETAKVNNLLAEKLGQPFDQLPAELCLGRGCMQCNKTGYKGRVPIFEVLMVDEQVRDAITAITSRSQLNVSNISIEHTLLYSAYNRVLDGVTTLEEALRVLGPQKLTK